MTNGSRLFRLGLVWLASTSLSLTGAASALAQDAQGGGGGGGGGDPPALAGRLSDLQGTVSYHPAGADQWSPATQNFPVTSGNAYWTEPQASATIEVGDDQFVMDGGTELDVTTLDQSQFVASEPQGAIFLGLRDLPDGQTLTVTTPRGAVQITQPGAYEIVAGDTNDPTSVTVVSGAAHVTANGVDLNVTARQTASITGADTFQGSIGAMAPDQFLSAQLQRFQPQPQQSAPPQVAQQVRYMTGGAALSQYGTWSQSGSYGQVWYPSNVGADWAPYREGHWAYVQPWGWNWVDDEPWGFAPFHYGRWINDGGRWGWVAGGGDVYGGGYPVYAPALVGFVGFGPGVLAGAAFGLGVGFGVGADVGWFPLGYREAYVPWYHVSDGYFRNVNRYSVKNYRNITINNYRNVTINTYHNARFASVAPAGAFAGGARMRGFARPMPAAALARAQPVIGRLPVAPTARTPGLSRAVAASYHVPMAARPAGEAGRGPQIHPGAFGQTRPALRTAAMPRNARPVGPAGERADHAAAPPGMNGAGAPRPGEGAGRMGAGAGMRAGGAPGPAIVRPGAVNGRAALPALRSARPEQAAPGVAHPGLVAPGAVRPGRFDTAAPHAGSAMRPDAQAARPVRGAEPRAAASGGTAYRGAERPAPASRPVAPSRPVAAPVSHPAAAPERRAAPERAPAPAHFARPPEASPRQMAPRPEPRPMAAPRPEPRPMAAPRPAPRPGPEHKG